MHNAVRNTLPSVQCLPFEAVATWRELTGRFSPITLTCSEVRYEGAAVATPVWTLIAESVGNGPNVAAWEHDPDIDPLERAERLALAWLDGGLVARAHWRVPLCEVERIYALASIASEAGAALSIAEVDALMADRAPLAAFGASALPVVTGSSRGHDLLAVAALARRALG